MWFEQHVKMSDEIAGEVKMILNLPSWGQAIGVLFIIIGVVQITFLPGKNYVSRKCCIKNTSKVGDFDKKIGLLEVTPQPEISPLLATEKPKNGIILGKNSSQKTKC